MPDNSEIQVPPPYPLAMVVCDTIWREPKTGKRFLLGCLSGVEVAEDFPITYPTLGVYVAMTNGRGKTSYKIQLVGEQEELEPIWHVEGEFIIDNPRAIVEFEFVSRDVVFPESGHYSFQFFYQ